MDLKPASRRRHSAELKDKVLAACAEPGASIAAVARAYDLNANLVHRWRRRRRARSLSSACELTTPQLVALPLQATPTAAEPTAARVAATRRSELPHGASQAGTAAPFVAVQLDDVSRTAPSDIRLELRRGSAVVIVSWPLQDAAGCGAWLRDWLR